MPIWVVFQATPWISVPAPSGLGRTLFSDSNNGWALTVKLSNWTTQILDATFTALWCWCGPCGWWGGWACDCLAVANCIQTDPNVQNALTIFNNTWFNWVATLWGLSDVDLTTTPPVPGDILSYDGVNRVPVTWGGATDELVKISATDTTPWYLDDKVVVWSANLVKAILNSGADEDLELDLNTTLTGMVSITTQDINVTWTATFTGTTNFNGWAINYTGNTITNVWVTETYDNTSTVTIDTLDVTNITYNGSTWAVVLKKTATFTPSWTSFTFADADSLADSVIMWWTITSGTQVGFWTFDVSTPWSITINSTATETAPIGITYILAV